MTRPTVTAGGALDQEARINLKESFLEDMSRHQRLKGGIPTPHENLALAQGVFERVERDAAKPEAPAAKPDPAAARAARAARRERLRERAAEKGYRLIRLEDEGGPGAVATFSPRDLAEYEAMNRRVELLLTKEDRGPLGQPSWHECIMAVLYLKIQGAPERKVDAKLRELCDLSSADFGDWRAAPAEAPLIFA